jgi:hypothetical protein
MFSQLALMLGLILFGASYSALGADNDTPGFGGEGLCRFAAVQYWLPKTNQDSINLIVGDLLRRHEAAFHFTASTNVHVRIRIFGTFESYRDFAVSNHVILEQDKLSISNLAGFYSPEKNEVVTWRQRDPAFLANNILHECSHAIMHAQFETLPIWLDEGCAVYFSYPTYMRTQKDERALLGQWYALRRWQKEGALPDLREFLDIDPLEFRQLDPQLSYPVSWSLFQLFMSSPQNQLALNEMMLAYQRPGPRPPAPSRLLDKYYPGGVAKMEKDWREWIKRGAAQMLGVP